MIDETRIENKLQELAKEFGAMGDPVYQRLAKLAKTAQENHEKLRQSVDSLQESLDFLRVCIKYQLFDLEATKRENHYLKKLLNEKEE